MSKRSNSPNPSRRKKKPAKLSRLSKPAEMTLEQWQIELRKQFGQSQPFRVKNLGQHPVFSEFRVQSEQQEKQAEKAMNEFRQPTRKQVRAESDSPTATDDPWSNLLQTGMALLRQWTEPRDGKSTVSTQGLVHRDEKTGENYLRLPAPDPKLLSEALQTIGRLLEGFRR